MPRGKVVDDIPVQVFRPASQIASWTLFGMLTLIGAIEASAYDTAKLTAHVVNSHIHFAFEWAMAMVVGFSATMSMPLSVKKTPPPCNPTRPC